MSFLGCGSNGATEEDASEDAQTTAASAVGDAKSMPVVEVIQPSKRNFDAKLGITGRLEANQEVSIHAMGSGFLKSIRKDIGDYVKKGETIALLENPTLIEEEKLAQVELKLTQSVHNRLNGIYQKTPDLTTVVDVEKARAEYEAAQAKLSAIQTKLGFLKVTAPFSGVVTKRYVDKGALVQNGINNPSAAPLIDVMQISTLRLIIDFPESDISQVKKGTKLAVSFPELGSKTYDATVSRLAYALNPSTKTMRVEADLKNNGKELKPGMYAKVQVAMKSHEGAWSVPILAVLTEKKAHFVYEVRNKQVRKVPVRLGLEDKDYVEILGADFSGNEEIIIKGKELVSEGVGVKTKQQGL